MCEKPELAKRVAILGAGASRDYGFPLARGFFDDEYRSEYREYIRIISKESKQADTFSDVAYWHRLKSLIELNTVLDWYKGLQSEYIPSAEIPKDTLDVEDFWAYMDTLLNEAYPDVKPAQEELLFYIWMVITAKSIDAINDSKALNDWKSFWCWLGLTGSVISYNWDWLPGVPGFEEKFSSIPQLANSFSKLGLGNLYSNDIKTIREIAPKENIAGVGYWLPLHGNCMLLYCDHCPPVVGYSDYSIFSKFHATDGSHVITVMAPNMWSRHCHSCGRVLRPLMMPPGIKKDTSTSMFYSKTRELALSQLREATEIYVIGFSWNPADHHARTLLRQALYDRPGSPVNLHVIDIKGEKNEDERKAEILELYERILGKPGSPRNYSLTSSDIYLSGFRSWLQTTIARKKSVDDDSML